MDEAKITAMAVEAFLRGLMESSKPLFKKLNAEIKYLFDDGYYEYLGKQYKKHSMIKTILHRSVPKPFYDLYYPLSLEKDHNIIKTGSIKDIFKESNFITIIGDAGGGKSTLIKHLFLQTIKEKYAIPIFIELRYINDYDNNIETYIRDRVLQNQISPNNNILNRLLESGQFVFFLDGYDEIISEKKNSNTQNLISFITKYDQNKYILTSRPYTNIEWIDFFHNYKLCNLNQEDIYKFINKQGLGEEITNNIVDSIKNNNNRYIKEFLKNPLLLSLYVLTFKSHPDIPNKKYIFYSRVIDALISEHDALSKLGFERESLSGLDNEQYIEFLKKFCFISYFEGIYDFSKSYTKKIFNRIKDKTKELSFDNEKLIEDLKVNLSLWVEDNGIYTFSHRSLQEYFAALFIKNSNDKFNRKFLVFM